MLLREHSCKGRAPVIHLSPAMAQSAPKPVWSESSKKEVLSLLEASFANFVPLLLRGEKTPGDAEKMFLEYLRGGGLATNHDMLVPLLKSVKTELARIQ